MLNPLIKPIAPNMYRYDEFDAQFVGERVNQFAVQKINHVLKVAVVAG